MSKATKPTTLLDSAVEFLIEAIYTYNRKKTHFAMVHAVTAAELVLKERLARMRPNLIFKDIDAKDFATAQTVPLRHLPRRLLNLGIKITQDEAELVHQCANWRNQIVHHLPNFDPEELRLSFRSCLILSLNSCGENSIHPLRTFSVRSGTGLPSIFWRSGSAYSNRRRLVPIGKVTYWLRHVLTAVARAAFFPSAVLKFFVTCAAQMTTSIKNVCGANGRR